MKICKKCFREFEESEVDAVDVSPSTDVDSRFHGNDKEGRGNDRGECKNDKG